MSIDENQNGSAIVKQCLVATIHDELYALEVSRVREILRAVEIETAPGAPVFVVGLINLRGEIITVVDAACFLGISETRRSLADPRIVVVEGGGEMVGIRVDNVREVVSYTKDAIEYPQVTSDHHAGRYSRGVFYHERYGLIILMDVDALCANDSAALSAL